MSIACTDKSAKMINELYYRMSEPERIAQLRATYLNDYFLQDGSLDTAKCARELSNGIGHFSQYASSMSCEPELIRDRVAAMQQWLIDNTPNGIPALFHEEALSGVCVRGATVYPQQIGLACSFNPLLAQQKTFQTGRTLRKIGGMLALSPMVDVVRDPSFNRLEESYGEDAYLGAVMGTAFVRGLQKDGFKAGVGACSKHFLGYGGGGAAPQKELMEEILLPHETIIRLGGSKVVMTGYHDIDGTKCVANSFIQQRILRDYLGFDGMMVSDYGAVDQIPDYQTDMERGAAAIMAGNDVDFPKGQSYAYLDEALQKGLVSQEALERAVKQVLAYKLRAGLLDKKPVLYQEGDIEFDTASERQIAYELASESVVLLGNNGVLPLKAPQEIFLTGPNANSMWSMLGDYSFHSMRFFWQRQIEDELHPVIVTLKDGMEARMPEGFGLSYSRGCDWTEEVETIIEEGGDERAQYMRSILDRKVTNPDPVDMKEALAMASKSDVIIAAMGENVILCGENRDRTSLYLPGKQEEYVESLIATGKPVVLVLFGGRAQVISRIADKCAAVIQAWYPGEEGGNALADILYGAVSPSGKLSVSYPGEPIHGRLCYNDSITPDERVQWPFGYGLSYSSFEYSDLMIDKEVKTSAKCVSLSFSVTNTGEVAADEIVQVYLSPSQDNSQLRPIQLQGFARVSLAPGETKRVGFNLWNEQFGYFSDWKWNIAPGRYVVKVGASSNDIRLSGEVELKGAPVVKALREKYFSEQF